MPMPAEEIATLIKKAIPDAIVEMEALVDDNDHWLARVTSAEFAGKNRVQQHKMVFAALGERMGGELHALQLHTSIPN